MDTGFNPRAPCGARRAFASLRYPSRSFQSTRPVWGATWEKAGINTAIEFQSTRPVWGATSRAVCHIKERSVSIHAPRVGRDSMLELSQASIIVSIHAPRVGRDTICASLTISPACFNPRAPCGARHIFWIDPHHDRSVSIHAPRVGRDFGGMQEERTITVSIHAPRVGRDCVCHPASTHLQVSIHAPRVGRDLDPKVPGLLLKGFQSTRPVWGATLTVYDCEKPEAFQSTRPVWGATWRRGALCQGGNRFNPRAPCGARRDVHDYPPLCDVFQSTRPVWGATAVCYHAGLYPDVSIHAPRVGRDLPVLVAAENGDLFQSTRPVWGATATGVTTSPFCHVFMGIPLHKYDFLGT